MDTLQSYLNELRMIGRKLTTKSSYVYRDELNKTKNKKSQKTGSTPPPEAKPLLRNIISDSGGSAGEEEEEAIGGGGRGFKLKVLMTKEEAARLLSKCKDGRRLELKDLWDELTLIPATRVNVVSNSIHGHRPRLPTLPQETT